MIQVRSIDLLRASLCAWISMTVTTGMARADDRQIETGPPTVDEDSARELAREHLRVGHAHYHAGHYREAAVAYRAGYRAAGLVEFVFNLAQALRLAGDQEAALAEYRRFLDLAPDHPLRGEVTSRIARLEAELAPPPQPEPAHHAGVVAPAVHVRVDPPAAEVSDPASGSARPGRGLRALGLTLGAVGLVAVGAGVWYGVEADRIEGQLAGNDEPWPDDGADLLAQGRRAERRTIALTASGAVGVVSGLIVYSLGWRAGRAPAQWSVRATATDRGAGVVFGGSF